MPYLHGIVPLVGKLLIIGKTNYCWAPFREWWAIPPWRVGYPSVRDGLIDREDWSSRSEYTPAVSLACTDWKSIRRSSRSISIWIPDLSAGMSIESEPDFWFWAEFGQLGNLWRFLSCPFFFMRFPVNHLLFFLCTVMQNVFCRYYHGTRKAL